MSAMQRRKGGSGEREVAALLQSITGIEVKRRIRQHAGDGDLDLPGWAVEVKRHRTAPRASIATWWKQASRQADIDGTTPVLFYRVDRGPWRAVWAPFGGDQYADTCEADPALWWRSAGSAGPPPAVPLAGPFRRVGCAERAPPPR